MKNLKKSMFTNEKQRWSLRKVSVGLASVMLGLTFMTTSQSVKADTLNEEPGITQSISNTQITDDQESKETDIEKDEQTSSNEKNTSSLSDIEKDTMNDAENQYLSSNSTSNAKSENREKNEQVNSKGVDTSSLSDIEKDVTSDENNQSSSSDSISSFKSKNREEAEQTNIEEDQSSLSDIEKDITNDEKGQPHSSASTSSSESENRERTEQTNTKEVDKPSLSNTKKDIVNKENNQSLPSHPTFISKSKNKTKNKQINNKEENKSSAVIKKDTADKKKDQSFLSHSTFGSEHKNKKNATSGKDSSSSNNNSSKPSQPNIVSKNNNHAILKHDLIDTSKNSNLSNEKIQEETALEKLKKQNSLKTKKLIDQYSTLLKSISKDDWKEGFPEEKDATIKADGMSVEIGKVEDGPFPLVNNIIRGNKKSYTYVNSEGIDSRFGFIYDSRTLPLFLRNNPLWNWINSANSYKYAKKNDNLIIMHSSKYKQSYASSGSQEIIEKDNHGIPKVSVIEENDSNKGSNFSVDYLIDEYVIVTPDGDIIHKINLKNVGKDPKANNNWRYYVLIDTSLNNDDGTSLHSTGKGKNGIYLTNNDLLYGVRGLGDSEVYAVDYSKTGYGSDWQNSDVLASNYNIDEKIAGKDHNEIKDTAFRIMTPEMTLKEGESATIWYYEVPMIDSLNESLSKISDKINHDNQEEKIAKTGENIIEVAQKITDSNAKSAEKAIDAKDKLSDATNGVSDLVETGIKTAIDFIPGGKNINLVIDAAEAYISLLPSINKSIKSFRESISSYRKEYKKVLLGFTSLINKVKNKMTLKNQLLPSLKNRINVVRLNSSVLKKKFIDELVIAEKNLSKKLGDVFDKLIEGSMSVISDRFDFSLTGNAFSIVGNQLNKLRKIKVLENLKVLKWISSGIDKLKNHDKYKALMTGSKEMSKNVADDEITEKLGSSLGKNLVNLLIKKLYDSLILNTKNKFSMIEKEISSTISDKKVKKNRKKLKKLIM